MIRIVFVALALVIAQGNTAMTEVEPPVDPPVPVETPMPLDEHDEWQGQERSPIEAFLGDDLVRLYRVTTADIWMMGGVYGVMWAEPEAMVLTRVAMGEAPSSINDRHYIMWLIRLRAELGYKGAGYYSGYRDITGRWGPPTTIHQEALCWQGCQFEPVRVANNIYFPLEATGNMVPMLYPTDEMLMAFHITHLMAQEILAADLCDYPEELKGLDGFRSPKVTWIGTLNRVDGMRSVQLVQRGHIWRDETKDDNDYWDYYGCQDRWAQPQAAGG